MSMGMGLRKKAAVVAATTALIAGAGVATAGSAWAGYKCAPGYHCVFATTYMAGSAQHNFFNSDYNFTDDYFNDGADLVGYGENVNDHVNAASNSSTGGYESHYYRDINFQGGLLFCVNPGSSVDLGLADWQRQASSLQLRPTTTIHCF
ncbi:hypothetical protein ACH4A8_03270 [Streptomyces vietnamensis]|uniref:hypothetical protein n=1 Tax=Streptomyces vietnamensis TaxID=362257 RepID=UPI00342882B9